MDFHSLFSFSAKKAIYRASEICAQFSNQHLEPEHILASVLNLRTCSAVQVLQQLGVNLPKLSYSLEAYLHEHAGSYKGGSTFSARTLNLLDVSYKEMKRLHHREIGTTHLLIALVQERTSFLQQLFEEHGLDPKRIRDAFMMQLGTHSRGEKQGPQLSGKARARQEDQTMLAALGIGADPSIFTQPVLDAIRYSAQTARRFGALLLEPEHLLFGLLTDGVTAGNAPDQLQPHSPAAGPFALAGALLAGFHEAAAPCGPVPEKSERSVSALAEALKSCAARDAWMVTPLDMLVGVLATAGPQLAALVREHLGHEPEELRELLLEKLKPAQPAPGQEPGAELGGEAGGEAGGEQAAPGGSAPD